MTDARRKGNYVRVTDRPPDLVDPLDYLILKELPDEGELIGNYYPLAATVKNLARRTFPELTPAKLSGRVRSLEIVGLTLSVSLGTDKGWQRTKEGKEVYEAWQSQQKT